MTSAETSTVSRNGAGERGSRDESRRFHRRSRAPALDGPIDVAEKGEGFEHFLARKPEDDEQSYRAAVTRRKSPARGSRPAQNNKASFYAVLNADPAQTPLNKRISKRGDAVRRRLASASGATRNPPSSLTLSRRRRRDSVLVCQKTFQTSPDA